MIVLGLLTSTDACEATLCTGAGALIAERCEPMARGHDARLAPLVAELMAEAGLVPAALGRVGVCVGPGSFTGLRVGVAYARGLALALDIPAAGVTSLEAAAHGLSGRVLAALPARRRPPDRSWWAQLVIDGRGEGRPVEADAGRMRALAAGADALAGLDLPEIDPQMDKPIARLAAAPTALAVARLVAARAPDELRPPAPAYAREPDADPPSADDRIPLQP